MVRSLLPQRDFSKPLLAALLWMGSSFPVHAQTSRGVRLRPVAQLVSPEPAVGGEGRSGISIQFGSTLPFRRPYQAKVGKNLRDFRYQSSTAFLVEYAYGLTPNWEVGISTGFESLGSRAETGTVLTEFETAKLTQVPIQLLGRYRFLNKSWSPELEAGAGWSFGSFKLAATNLSVPDKAQKQSFFVAHAAAGAGFPWTEALSLHWHAGLQWTALGSKVFKTSLLDIQQNSLIGVFFRADFRFQF